VKSKKASKKVESEESEEERPTKASSSKKASKKVESEESEESEEERPKKASSSKSKKASKKVESEESEEERPKKASSSKKTPKKSKRVLFQELTISKVNKHGMKLTDDQDVVEDALRHCGVRFEDCKTFLGLKAKGFNTLAGKLIEFA
jgi:hypothetical protein